MSRRYRADLRDEQAASTRERLLDAAHRLLGHIRPVDLSYAQIAEEAGVSVRTLYRHFPTSDELFLALSNRVFARVGADAGDSLMDVAKAMTLVQRTFESMESDPALFRVFFAVPTRSRMGGRTLLEGLLAPYVAHLSPDGRTSVFALVDLMVSPYAWDVFHANWGANADLAYRACCGGIRSVLELAIRYPSAFDHISPFPEPP